MAKYKCPTPGCKYMQDEPGDCCGQSLIKISDEEAAEILSSKTEEVKSQNA